MEESFFLKESGCLPKHENIWKEAMKTSKRKELGQYIVADPEICHGQLTFKGTRIMVKSVLEMLAKGWDWDQISQEYLGKVSHAAIAEAVSLANEALLEKTDNRRRATIVDAYRRAYGKQLTESDLTRWADEGTWPEE
jgi:uncharacterized protein (DUF433 family)